MSDQAAPRGETPAEREERVTRAWVGHLTRLPADTPRGWLEHAHDVVQASPDRREAQVAMQRIVDGLAEVATGAQCEEMTEAA